MAKKETITNSGAIGVSATPNPGCIFAIRCFIDGRRVRTDLLNKDQAKVFRITAQHLIKYLTEAYKLGK